MTESANGSVLERLERLLGTDVFFVPCEWGTKKPLVTYVDRPFESTKSSAYRAMFELQSCNVAVYLGAASGGLCAIDFDDDADLAAFLALNPKLAGTTRTVGSRGGMLWVRIVGGRKTEDGGQKSESGSHLTPALSPKGGEGEAAYPPSCTTEHFEWRADKRLSTIAGLHPKGKFYRFEVEAPPVRVRFEELAWPEEWDLPWVSTSAAACRADLVGQYGEPFYTTKDGRVFGINERFWAGMFAREHRVLFDPEERAFHLYDEESGLWRHASSEWIREVISARILEVSRESKAFTLEIQITQAKLNAVVSALKGIAEKRGVFRGKAPLVHVANGVIRFADDGAITFGGFSPDDYSRNQSPYPFDAVAECPRFVNELIAPAVSEDDADLLQRWFGLALYGYNLPQRFLILDGTPNGGKGTLVRIVQALVGVVNTAQLRTELLHERFETFRYRGKTLLIGADVAGDFLMHRGATVLKSLVGGDSLNGEGKGMNGDFQMFGTFNVVMTCNSRLRVRLDGDAGAWRRRLLIVRYERPPPAKRILDFDRVLLASEASGILRWALAGFVRLQEEFRAVGDFMLSDAQRGRIESLLSESESLRVFLKERVEPHAYGDVTNNEMVTAYAEFCGERGWNPLPVTLIERQLGDLMLELFQTPKTQSIERDGKKSNRGWRRVRLKAVGGAQVEG